MATLGPYGVRCCGRSSIAPRAVLSTQLFEVQLNEVPELFTEFGVKYGVDVATQEVDVPSFLQRVWDLLLANYSRCYEPDDGGEPA